MAINVGAVAGPLFCGFLASRYGWHTGFGAAAIFMLAGLATYLAGYRYLPARVERRTSARPPPRSRSGAEDNLPPCGGGFGHRSVPSKHLVMPDLCGVTIQPDPPALYYLNPR